LPKTSSKQQVRLSQSTAGHKPEDHQKDEQETAEEVGPGLMTGCPKAERAWSDLPRNVAGTIVRICTFGIVQTYSLSGKLELSAGGPVSSEPNRRCS